MSLNEREWVKSDRLRLRPVDEWIDGLSWLGVLDLPDVYFISEYKFLCILSEMTERMN